MPEGRRGDRLRYYIVENSRTKSARCKSLVIATMVNALPGRPNQPPPLCPLPNHLLRRNLIAIKHAADINPQHPLHILLATLQHRFDLAYPRVRHHHIQWSQRFHRFRHEVFDLVAFGDVGHDADDIGALWVSGADVVCEGGELGRVGGDVVDAEGVVESGEVEGNGFTAVFVYFLREGILLFAGVGDKILTSLDSIPSLWLFWDVVAAAGAGYYLHISDPPSLPS